MNCCKPLLFFFNFFSCLPGEALSMTETCHSINKDSITYTHECTLMVIIWNVVSEVHGKWWMNIKQCCISLVRHNTKITEISVKQYHFTHTQVWQPFATPYNNFTCVLISLNLSSLSILPALNSVNIIFSVQFNTW